MTNMLWQPSAARIVEANVTAFRKKVAQDHQLDLADYESLYRWSVEQPERFWSSVWDDGEVIAATRGQTVLDNGDRMPGARWFPQARLNFAENLLRKRDDSDALVFWGEDKVRRRLSHAELYEQVSRMAQALRAMGVGIGDRVAGYMPNMPETVTAMLATTSIGATWCSCSPDFGVNGVVDRFGQIEPKVLFSADGYFYNGKVFDCTDKLPEICGRIPSLERVIVVPYARDLVVLGTIPHAVMLADFVAHFHPRDVEFARLPFDHPLYIMFSSGTTGAPKCIVHGAGGTLLQHLKEHRLHADIKPGDKLFYFTTCGWMMWNWLVSGLASGATLLLYDGSPFYPDGNVLFDYADAEGMTVFGTSAKYIEALNKADLTPKNTHTLATVQTMCSTGSPLAPESFDFVYERIKGDLCLSSISGGTDILSCFALGSSVLPVWRGELQCRGLGLKVEVWNDEGQSVRAEKGELLCTAPFPAMPVGFWNDPNGERYHAAYFERFPNVWCHGDYVELTEHDGVIIHGRSDAVLNPGGVRIGTAEIYRQVEQLNEVVESLVIGQAWDNDVRVVLFARLREGLTLDDALIKRMKDQIRRNTTPRHVPAKIVQVSDIPCSQKTRPYPIRGSLCANAEDSHTATIQSASLRARPSLDQYANRASTLKTPNMASASTSPERSQN